MTAKNTKAEIATETTTEETTTEVVAASTNSVTVLGAFALRFKGVTHVHGSKFELSDDDLNSQAIKHLFVRKQLEFTDDPVKTREYLANIKVKGKTKTSEEGPTIK